MSEDTRTILKKLMRDALDEKDRQRLLCDPKVEERMRSQWDEAADRVNPVVGESHVGTNHSPDNGDKRCP